MGLKICSLASSSSGNCYLIKGEDSVIILDVGISLKRIKENLGLKGIDLEEVDAILVTHEHVDHVKSLKALVKKTPKAKVYLSNGTYSGIKSKYTDIALELAAMEDERIVTISGGKLFKIGDIEVKAFNVSHDTNEPTAYSFKNKSGIVSVVTDTGYVTEEIYETIKLSDILIIESNHEPEILMYGSYPYQVKRRILSDFGHLSNEACANCLVRIIREKRERENEKKKGKDASVMINFDGERSKPLDTDKSSMPRIFLAHLSTENNTPEQAMLTVSNILEESNIYIGRDLTLETLRKDEASNWISLR